MSFDRKQENTKFRESSFEERLRRLSPIEEPRLESSKSFISEREVINIKNSNDFDTISNDFKIHNSRGDDNSLEEIQNYPLIPQISHKVTRKLNSELDALETSFNSNVI